MSFNGANAFVDRIDTHLESVKALAQFVEAVIDQVEAPVYIALETLEPRVDEVEFFCDGGLEADEGIENVAI